MSAISDAMMFEERNRAGATGAAGPSMTGGAVTGPLTMIGTPVADTPPASAAAIAKAAEAVPGTYTTGSNLSGGPSKPAGPIQLYIPAGVHPAVSDAISRTALELNRQYGMFGSGTKGGPWQTGMLDTYGDMTPDSGDTGSAVQSQLTEVNTAVTRLNNADGAVLAGAVPQSAVLNHDAQQTVLDIGNTLNVQLEAFKTSVTFTNDNVATLADTYQRKILQDLKDQLTTSSKVVSDAHTANQKLADYVKMHAGSETFDQYSDALQITDPAAYRVVQAYARSADMSVINDENQAIDAEASTPGTPLYKELYKEDQQGAAAIAGA
jgi:hypothetical protein